MITFPTKAEDFEYIYNANGTCTIWYCGRQGVILAYDTFSPEVAHWFCQDCWDEMEGDDLPAFMDIIEDRRQPN